MNRNEKALTEIPGYTELEKGKAIGAKMFAKRRLVEIHCQIPLFILVYVIFRISNLVFAES